MRSQDDDLAIGYVQCEECGRPIEAHTSKGLEDCPERWTHAEVVQIRKMRGLPGKYNRLEWT